jgi:hypothetical protein
MCLLLRDTAEMACRVAQRITYVTNDTNGRPNPDFRNNFTKHEIMYNYKCSDQNNMLTGFLCTLYTFCMRWSILRKIYSFADICSICSGTDQT